MPLEGKNMSFVVLNVLKSRPKEISALPVTPGVEVPGLEWDLGMRRATFKNTDPVNPGDWIIYKDGKPSNVLHHRMAFEMFQLPEYRCCMTIRLDKYYPVGTLKQPPDNMIPFTLKMDSGIKITVPDTTDCRAVVEADHFDPLVFIQNCRAAISALTFLEFVHSKQIRNSTRILLGKMECCMYSPLSFEENFLGDRFVTTMNHDGVYLLFEFERQ